MIKLRDLEFNHCEGYYSKNANACIFPCSISERDSEDQMIQIYEKVILWADIVFIATPIRWGSASSLYYKMIQRMNCVQNHGAAHNAIANSENARQLDDYRGYDLYQDTSSDTTSYAAIGNGALLLGSSKDALKGAVDHHEGDGAEPYRRRWRCTSSSQRRASRRPGQRVGER